MPHDRITGFSRSVGDRIDPLAIDAVADHGEEVIHFNGFADFELALSGVIIPTNDDFNL